MRIGLFTDTYPPNINGVATSVCMLKKALEKKGHQVFLVTVNPDNMKFVYEDNGKTIKLPGLPVGIYDYRLSGIYGAVYYQRSEYSQLFYPLFGRRSILFHL